ncbi:MAG: hypothetical protein DWQ10_06150 [Calditrichaeota bacterium]|nr:MAG: hypothetical protein DWQ10_06150 [Calditrichota bacterium]
MNFSEILFFYLPLVIGIYFYFKDIKKFCIVYLVDYAKGITFLGIPSLTANDIFHFMILLYLFDFFFVKKIKLQFDKGGKLLTLFFLFFVVHAVVGQNHDMPRSFFNKFFLFWDFLFFLAVIVTEKDAITLTRYSIYSYFIKIVMGLFILFFNNLFTGDFYSFQVFEYKDGFRYGALNSAYVLFIFSIVFLKGWQHKIGILTSIVLIFISGSRTSLILIIVVVYAYLFLVGGKKRVKTSLHYVLPVTAIIFLFTVYIQKYSDDLPIYFGRYVYFLSNPIEAGGGRQAAYLIAVDKIKENVLLGNPVQNRRNIRQFSRNKNQNAEIHALSGYMQNAYLANFYVYGLSGFLLMLSILYYYLKFSRRLYLYAPFKYKEYFLFIYLMVISAIFSCFSGGSYFSILIPPVYLSIVTYFVHFFKYKNKRKSVVFEG